MSDTYVLTRRDFMKMAGVGALLTAYAAKVAGTGEIEGRASKETLENKSDTPESTLPDSKPIDPGYWDLILQVRSNAILYGDINVNSNAPYNPR